MQTRCTGVTDASSPRPEILPVAVFHNTAMIPYPQDKTWQI
jgi:hypothetical protein